MKTKCFIVPVVSIILLSATVQADSLLDKTVVYIECKVKLANGGEKSSRGSGVLVSPNGKVLTSKHVIPEENNAVCEGSIGNAFERGSKMIIRKKSSTYDAALLQFSSNGKTFDYLKYCKLDDSFRKETIFATGFPGYTETGVPSSRIGVLSTVLAGPNGLIETDSATAKGMSGGMVTLGNSSHLVGIIAGAEFDPSTGAETFWGVLPVEMVANEFELSQAEQSCIRKSKLSEEFEWNSNMSSLNLGMKTGEGYCFITKTWGVFNHEKDRVSIEDNDNKEFVLTGGSDGGGKHGGSARCIWF